MSITAETTVFDLVETYPYMLDWLCDYDSHFENLRNPVLFKTMARVASLETAASMASVPVDKLIDDVRSAVVRHEIAAEGSRAAAPTPAADGGTAEAARRQEQLRAIILKLHDGAAVAEVKAEFDALASGADSLEIARMEQALISEGMPVEEVQRLCDVHVAVFKDALETGTAPEVEPGHPVAAYRRENEAATRIVADVNLALGELAMAVDARGTAAALGNIAAGLDELAQIDAHYTRKENQLFPVLEAHGVEGPTKVMWALDDDIRVRIKTARALASAGDVASLALTLPETLRMVDDMVYKEEKILLPTALSVVKPEEWARMAAGDAEIGYAWSEGPAGEVTATASALVHPPSVGQPGESPLLPLPTGALTLTQLDLLFRVLPFDLTYVDEDDRVRFYSEGERVFPRSPGVIGREVRNCHPPKSLAKVEQILAEFKAGAKDVAEFWIQMGPRFVHIRYIALHDDDGTYRGSLEIVQDASHVRQLEGERRIVDW